MFLSLFLNLPVILKSSLALPPALMVISLFSDYRNGLPYDVSCIMKRGTPKTEIHVFQIDRTRDYYSIVETAHVFLKTQISSMNFGEVNLISNVSRATMADLYSY